MPDDSRPLPPGLVILWVSRDPEAARNMAFMYARNSRLKGWWPVVKLVVWGPSAQVLWRTRGSRRNWGNSGRPGWSFWLARPAPTATRPPPA